MQSKNLSLQIILITFFAGFGLFFSIIYYPQKLNSGGSVRPLSNSIALAKQAETSIGLPLRLKIPGINVDAVVEQVGLTSKGAMDVPKGRANVGWFKLEKRPGEIGSAVIAGHFGIWENGERSVFDDLSKLRQGDKLYVMDDKGAAIPFTVQSSRVYDPEADATDVFSSNDGKSHLNLVTCKGWNEVSQTFTKRLVIFTDKE